MWIPVSLKHWNGTVYYVDCFVLHILAVSIKALKVQVGCSGTQ